MSSWPLTRGQVIRADIGLDEPKLIVVVSNNPRNRHLPQVLGVRLTTTSKPRMPSIVQLAHPEVFNGYAVCDDIVEIYEDEVVTVVGALTPQGMLALGDGLRAALSL